ncbi:hypothetical protein LOD99_1603 [Oopsacas minuta]|uniref:Uncharacterized protein n=1 Tax=Oopsacas minuta TaxID=111878 RepID=A0AAV7K577_9METZ|nr:hypothetical protein LOD99_1603 [Oopsacas minuta]
MSTNNSTIILGRSVQVGAQAIIVVFGFLIALLTSCWLYCIIQKVKDMFRELKLLGKRSIDSSIKRKILKLKSKQSKHLFFLFFIVLFIAHILVRSIIYLTFVFAEYFGDDQKCYCNKSIQGLKFVHSMLMYIFPMLSISGVLFIASLISLGTFLLYEKESYSYFGKKLRPIKIWIFIGIVQIVLSFLLQIIPWVIIAGSVVLSCSLLLDYTFLVIALKRLVKTLKVKKLDANHQTELKFRYKQCIKGIRTLSRPSLISLFVYICGLILEQISVWITLGECFMVKYYGTHDLKVDRILITNIASFLWIFTYITIFQFYISSLLIALAYFYHSRSNKKGLKDERKRLITGKPPTHFYGEDGNETDA